MSQYASLKRFGDGLAVQALSSPGSPNSMRSHSESPQIRAVSVDQNRSLSPVVNVGDDPTVSLIKNCMSKHFDSLRDKEEVMKLRRALSESKVDDPDRISTENKQLKQKIATLTEAMTILHNENNNLKQQVADFNSQEEEVDAVVNKSLVAVQNGEKEIQNLLKEIAYLKTDSSLIEAKRSAEESRLALLEYQKQSQSTILKLTNDNNTLLFQLRSVFKNLGECTGSISSTLDSVETPSIVSLPAHKNEMDVDVRELLRENAMLHEANCNLADELALAREAQAVSFQAARSLLSLVESYAEKLKIQSHDEKIRIEGFKGQLGSSTTASRFEGTESSPELKQPTTPNRQPTTPSRQPILNTSGTITPMLSQQIIHESPPVHDTTYHRPLKAITSEPPPQVQSPSRIIHSELSLKKFPTKIQRIALLAGDAWAPKGTQFDSRLVIGVAIPKLYTSNTKMEPMLLGGRVYKIYTELDNGESELSFFNGTRDMQFTLEYTFLEGSYVVPGSEDAIVGEHNLSYTMTVYPGCTKCLVRGVLNGYSMNMRYGFASSSCLESYRKNLDEKLSISSTRVRSHCAKSNVDAENCLAVADICAAKGVPFVDPVFTPSQTSISRVFEESVTSRPWIRMTDALSSRNIPVGLFTTAIEPTDIDCGLLENSWLLSAMAILAEDSHKILTIFESSYTPSSQTTQQQDHQSGVYRLRLCSSGWWNNIIVDDWLPASPLGPAFARSLSQGGALWPSIIQKAFAKLFGSYSSLKGGGDVFHALTDLTGCGCNYYNWKNSEDSWKELTENIQSGYLVVVTTPGVDPSLPPEGNDHEDALVSHYRKIGLVTGYSYLIVGIDLTYNLCKIRNCWGNTELWNTPNNDEGTISVHKDELNQLFDSGGVCYAKSGQVSFRAQVKFNSGLPDTMIALEVAYETTLIVSIHQSDNRGTGDPEDEHSAFSTSVVGQLPTNAWSLLHSSYNGTFWKGRDTVLRVTLRPSTRPYYFIPRSYKELSTTVTFSFVFDNQKKGTTARFLKPTNPIMESLHFDPIYNFDPSGCTATAPLVQIGRGDPAPMQTVTVSDSALLSHYN